MPCPDPLLIQAYADGELDAVACVEVEKHLAGCAACVALRDSIGSTGAALRAHAIYHRLPPARRAALLREFGQDGSGALRPRSAWSFWRGVASGAMAAGLAVLAFTFLVPGSDARLLRSELVNAHVRSLLGNRLIEVESTDRHTVKPWFAGRVDVSPPVADFAAQHFALLGGRVDYVDGHPAAVVVYRHGAHIINVFSWRAAHNPLPRGIVAHDGYQMTCWATPSIDSCAISDTAPDELAALARLLAASASPEARE